MATVGVKRRGVGLKPTPPDVLEIRENLKKPSGTIVLVRTLWNGEPFDSRRPL